MLVCPHTVLSIPKIYNAYLFCFRLMNVWNSSIFIMFGKAHCCEEWSSHLDHTYRIKLTFKMQLRSPFIIIIIHMHKH